MEIEVLGRVAGFALEHKVALVGAGYLVGGAAVVGRAFPRWALGIAEKGRREGNYGGLEAFRVVPYAHASAPPTRAVAALESMAPDPFDGVSLGFVVGKKTDCVISGRALRAPLAAVAAEYGSEANFEPVEDLAEVMADGPERFERAGLVGVYRCYELAGGAKEGLGTAALSEFGGADPLDGALSRVVRAVDAEAGEAAMVQVHLWPATRAATASLKGAAERHTEKPEAPRARGTFFRTWDWLMMQYGTERGARKVERRDRTRHADARAAEIRQPKETEASRHARERARTQNRFDVSFSALGWVAPGREADLEEAFDAYFERFSREGRGELRRTAGPRRGLPARASVAELRMAPPERPKSEVHPVVTPQEVAAIWHPLGIGSAVPNRNVASLVTSAPTSEMPEDGLCLGVSNHGEARGTPLRIGVETLDTHGDITGKTGKGKSSLQLELIRSALSWPYVHDPGAEEEDAGVPARLPGGAAWKLARRHAERLKAAAGAPEEQARALLEEILGDEKMGFMLFDPKGGELFTKVISCLPGWRKSDVTVLDPGDEEYPVARLNFFDPFDHMEPDDQAATIVGALEQRFPSGFGANMRPIFVHAALACIGANKKLKDGGHEPSYGLLHLTETAFLAPRIDGQEGDYEQPRVRQEVLNHLRGDPDWEDVVGYWDGKDANQSGAQQAKEWNPITNKIAHFKNRKLARFIGGGRSDIDLMRTLQEGRILLFNLSQGSLPADTHELVGTLVLNLLCRTSAIRHDRAVRRGDAEELRRFLVVIDEAQNFACPEMTKTLTEGRSQRTPLWIGHQYVDQFDDKKLMGALANVGTRVLFGTTPDDAKKAAVFVPDDRFTPAAIEKVPKHNFVVVRDEGAVITGSTLKMALTDNAYVKDVREGSARALAVAASPGSVAALEATLLMGTADEPDSAKGFGDVLRKGETQGEEKLGLMDPLPLGDHPETANGAHEEGGGPPHGLHADEEDMPSEIEVDPFLPSGGAGDASEGYADLPASQDDDMTDTFEEGMPG